MNNEFSTIGFVVMFELNNTQLPMAKYLELQEIRFKGATFSLSSMAKYEELEENSFKT